MEFLIILKSFKTSIHYNFTSMIKLKLKYMKVNNPSYIKMKIKIHFTYKYIPVIYYN